MNKVVKDGFADSFKVTDQGLFSCAKHKYYSAAEVCVRDYYRFEGQSDPGDNAIMYVIETADGVKGTLIDAYGPYADAGVVQFMQQIAHLQKKPGKIDAPIC